MQKSPLETIQRALEYAGTRPESLLRFAEKERHVVPVHEVVKPRFEVLRAGIAVVDVVAVLPHIDTQQRMRVAVHQRAFAVRSFADFELAVLEAEPGPARAELRRAGSDEVGAELVVATQIAVNQLQQLAQHLGRAATTIGLHPVPERRGGGGRAGGGGGARI